MTRRTTSPHCWDGSCRAACASASLPDSASRRPVWTASTASAWRSKSPRSAAGSAPAKEVVTVSRRFYSAWTLVSFSCCSQPARSRRHSPARGGNMFPPRITLGLIPLAGQPEAVAAGALDLPGPLSAVPQGRRRRATARRSLLSQTDRIRAATDGDLEWFLRQGDLGHGMPSWSSLPEAQRWQLITYLRSLQ